MELWRLRCKLRYHFSQEERAAIKGEIPMTEELFWKCMDTCWKRFDMDVSRRLWNQYPDYIQAVKVRAQTRQLTEEEKAYYEDLKNRVEEYLDKSRET